MWSGTKPQELLTDTSPWALLFVFCALPVEGWLGPWEKCPWWGGQRECRRWPCSGPGMPGSAPAVAMCPVSHLRQCCRTVDWHFL